MEKQTWLDALYKHPRRDEILQKFIQNYYYDSKGIQLKSIDQTIDDNGEPIIDVTYLSKIYMSVFGCCDENETPLEMHLMIGEYYTYEHQNNVVKIHGPLLKQHREFIGKKYRKKAISPKEYIFDATSPSGRDISERFKVDGYSYGLNGHFMLKILETLNEGVMINGETYTDMLKRKSLPIMEQIIAEKPELEAHHRKRFNDYFDKWLMPLGAFMQMKDVFPIKDNRRHI